MANGGRYSPPIDRIQELFLNFQRAFRAGDLDTAEQFVHERIALLTAAYNSADSPDLARASTNLGLIHLFRNDLDAAERHFSAALDMDRRLNHLYGIARSMGNLALVPEARGDLDRAESLYREALAIAQSIKADDLAATKLANLGDIALRRENPAAARELWQQALALFTKLNDTGHAAELHSKLAALNT